ncbi:helix-turn-helix domain-containing protein [Hyphomicrobium facile]|uniref:AraC-type DNA-binding protein n=1 Tax=Hyphomicrobium facile TaxID=51670 RepID=A0A1I7NFZ7_9HYPH|nr:helix-turn-helix domain-containing protein [Hyphomicrobium facile]SFV33476.1 AraC-type DNA-binding protein [Hyphomicrobium facile]
MERYADTPTDLVVWDTEYFPSRQALDVYNNGVRTSCLPWSNDLTASSQFCGRIESRPHSSGTINRVRVTPHFCLRSAADVRMSSTECVYASYILGGDVQIEQAGWQTTARKGDIALYRSDLPISIKLQPDAPHQVMVMLVSKDAVDKAFRSDSDYTNVVIPREKMAKPLAACASFLARQYRVSKREELDSVIDALLQLLPTGTSESQLRGEDAIDLVDNPLRTKLVAFVEENIQSRSLTPRLAADHLNVSTRYIHKMFAATGQTFSTYVACERLKHIGRELASGSEQRQPISSLAYRWGFDSISTFNRAFRRHFGCSPSSYREKALGLIAFLSAGLPSVIQIGGICF